MKGRSKAVGYLGRMKRGYLVAYNGASTVLWSYILWKVVGTLLKGDDVHETLSRPVRWVQSLALAELLHSAIGLVRAPWTTTLIQVASRILLVWGIDYPFDIQSSAYVSMVVAWSMTEVVRYGYYLCSNISGAGVVPDGLIWLRYSLFYVLYPVGVASEMTCIWTSLDKASPLYAMLLRGVLFGYVPGK